MKKSNLIRFLCSIIALILFYYLQAEAGSFVNPTGEGYRYISKGYKNPDTRHSGLDMTGEKQKDIENQPAAAAADGKVIKADWDNYEKKKNPETGKVENVPKTEGKGSGGLASFPQCVERESRGLKILTGCPIKNFEHDRQKNELQSIIRLLMREIKESQNIQQEAGWTRKN